MGQPIDCESSIDSSGDTIQRTSTGTAWFTLAQAVDADLHRRLPPLGVGPRRSHVLVRVRMRCHCCSMDYLTDRRSGQTPQPAPCCIPHEVPVGSHFRAVRRRAQAGWSASRSASPRWMRAWPGRRMLPRGCIVLSFDDALASQLRNAVPVLTEFNITAMFFVMPRFSRWRAPVHG